MLKQKGTYVLIFKGIHEAGMLSPHPGWNEHFEQILINRVCHTQIIINLFRTPTNPYYITFITQCYYGIYLDFVRQLKPQLREQVLIEVS